MSPIRSRFYTESPFPLFQYLDDIMTILGPTKATLFPFLMHEGGNNNVPIRAYKSARFLNPHDESGSAHTLQSENYPYRHVGGVHSYMLHSSDNANLQGDDSTDYEFPTNTAQSVGCWIYAEDITTVTLMSKYDVNNQRHWRLQLDGSSKIELESYDESANADRTGASDTAVTAREWAFVVATYDGVNDNASMSFYLNGAADGTGSAKTGAYLSQDVGTAVFTIGATLNTTPAVTNLYHGRIALPFVTGTELTAANVASLYGIGQELLGLA